MQKSCLQCAQPFEITDEDLKFYDKVSPVFAGKKFPIPAPTLCPVCRLQRRVAWRNERKLYRQNCDLCQKQTLSKFAPGRPFPVYCPECWWSDKWDPYRYGQDIDFNRPFFDQIHELSKKVPHMALGVHKSSMENSDYCNQAGYLKNCYWLFNSDYSEQCLYGKGVNRSFDCVDCLKVTDSQACYEIVNSNNCSFSTYLINSHNSSECHFSDNLVGCNNCFGSVNLRNKEFYFFNEKLDPQTYAEKVAAIRKEKTPAQIHAQFKSFRSKYPVKWMQEKNTENCTGDYLVNSKNCHESFDCEYLEESKFCTDIKKGDKVSFQNYDLSYFGTGVDFSYEGSVVGYNVNHLLFCENVWTGSNDVMYSLFCMQNAHDLFGCVGLKHAEYSILNKKYSKEEYETLAAKIIEHMQTPRAHGASAQVAALPTPSSTNKEWGEFFPMHLSPFGYNETDAMDYYPLTKDQALKLGANWKDEDELPAQPAPKIQIPQNINDVTDDITKQILTCEICQKNYKIIAQELKFYRKMSLPIPKNCFECRHKARFLMRNPRKLWDRACDKCQAPIKTSYKPDASVKDPAMAGVLVYCEDCYLKEVY